MKLLPLLSLALSCLSALQAQRISRIEVVQAVQNADQTVPLVAGKPTVARVFPAAGAPGAEFKATLRARNVAGALGALDSGFQRIEPAQAGSRGSLAASIQFALPDAWTAAGDIELDADLIARDGATGRLDRPLALRFADPPSLPRPLRIQYVRVCDPDCPETDFAPAIAQLLPVADDQLIWEPFADLYTSYPAVLLREAAAMRLYSTADLLIVLRREPVFDTPVAASAALRLAIAATQPDAPGNVAHAVVALLGVPKSQRAIGPADFGLDRFAAAAPAAPAADLTAPPANRAYWMAADTFTRLFGAKLDPVAGATVNTITLSGSIRRDATGANLRPAFQAAGVAAEHDASATTCTRFFGSGEAPVATFCFKTLSELLDLASRPDSDPFTVRAPFPAGTTRIVFTRDGREVGSIAASPAAPTVSAPNGRPLAWTAADADNQALTFRLLASTDGVDWRPLGLELADSQLALDPAVLPPGLNFQFRVLASDGFHTAAATSAASAVARTAGGEAPPRDLRPPEALLGSASDVLIPVANNGNRPLAITAVRSTNDAIRPYMTRLPLVIPPGTRRSLQLRSQPASQGVYTSLITVTTDDPALPAFSLSVLGSAFGGAAPAVEVTPAPIDFGELPPGQTRQTTAQIRNSGGATLAVSSLRVSQESFAVVSPQGAFQVAPGASQAVTLSFSPGTVGTYGASLTVSSNDALRPAYVVALTGVASGSAPPPPPPPGKLEASLARLDFGDVAVGQSKDLSIELKNTGGTAVAVTAVGTSGAVFAITTAASFAVPTGGSHTVTLRFTPAAGGPASANLTITATGLDPVVVPLSGIGATAPPPPPPPSMPVLFSDTFRARIAGDSCALGATDLAAGGVAAYRYIPLAVRASAARVDEGALINLTSGFGGVAFTTRADVCNGGVTASNIGQALIVRADVLLPAGTQGGPMFHTSPLQTGDGLFGTTHGGFWVQVHSDGSVKLRRLDTAETLAATPAIGGFDPARYHNVEAVIENGGLIVRLDGAIAPLAAGGAAFALPSPGAAANGGAGFAFGSEPAVLTGQRVRDLSVSTPTATAGVPFLFESASIVVSPNNVVTFGPVAIGQFRNLELAVRNAGGLPLTIRSVRFTSDQFAINTPPPLPLTIPAGATQTISIRFEPKFSGAHVTDMTIQCNDPRRPEVLMTMTGAATATSGTRVTQTLQVDDGTWERSARFTRSLFAVNRLTPPGYPATLRAIHVFFRDDAFSVGHAVTMQWGSATGDPAAPPGSTALTNRSVSIQRTGRFFEYTLPATLTINSGDFIVGFQSEQVEGNIITLDTSSGPKDRSWIRVDGGDWTRPQAFEGLGPGNLLIRAVVDAPPR